MIVGLAIGVSTILWPPGGHDLGNSKSACQAAGSCAAAGPQCSLGRHRVIDRLADAGLDVGGGVNTVVAASAGDTGKLGFAERLGIETDMVVQELGWDDDVDDDVRAAIEEVIGAELLDEDSDDIVDVVLLWWRDDDGDLVDTLVDARAPLADNGVIWVLTPKTGRDGHVEPSDIAEAAPTVGLAQTSNISLCEDWTATRLATPKAAKAKR